MPPMLLVDRNLKGNLSTALSLGKTIADDIKSALHGIGKQGAGGRDHVEKGRVRRHRRAAVPAYPRARALLDRACNSDGDGRWMAMTARANAR